MREYYDLLDRKLSPGSLKSEIKRLIELDPLFLDPYLVVAGILMAEGKGSQGIAEGRARESDADDRGQGWELAEKDELGLV
jgi:hypothetical protein